LVYPCALEWISLLALRLLPNCIDSPLSSPAGSHVGYTRGVLDDSPTGSSIGIPADPWVLVFTHLRHGLASGLFAGEILVSATGSPLGLRVLHGWLDRGSVSRRKALLEHQGVRV
jgi:hypothetical protein